MRAAPLPCLALLLCCEKPAEVPHPSAPAPHEAEPADHKDEPAHEGLPTRIRLTAEAQKEAKVRVEEVQRGQLAPTVDLTGELVADPDQVARLAARAPGRVVEVRFKEGDTVQKGTVMALLESADLAKARAAWTSTAARAETARQNATRVASVAKDGLVPIQNAATADGEARALEADATAARQVLSAFGVGVDLAPPDEASRLVLKAPITGTVTMRNAVVGETVNAEHALATVVNLQKVYFQARLFERNLAEVQPGKHADVRLNAFPLEAFAGVVESVGQQVDPVARTVVARVALKNRGGILRLGLFGIARVVVDRPASSAEVLTIPSSAVTRLGQGDVAFVAEPDGHFEVHSLTLGTSAAGRVEVIRGVSAGEKVVVEGVLSLKSVVLKSTFGEEE